MTAEEERVAERQAGLADWGEGSVVALMRWATTIGADPQEMLLNPASGIARVEQMLDGEDVAGLPVEDRNWVTSHLLAHVAAVLMHNHGGGWAVDADPESPTYTRYVIDVDGTYYDPARAVGGYLKSRPAAATSPRTSRTPKRTPPGPPLRASWGR